MFFVGCAPPDCTEEQTAAVRQYKAMFDLQIQPVLSSPASTGYFLDSCVVHCQTLRDEPWSQYAINGRTVAQSFGDWYFNRTGPTRLKDCDTDFPCNPTCSDVGGAPKNVANTYMVLALLIFAAYHLLH